MRFAEDNRSPICCNWIAILSYSGALVLSLAIWGSLFRVAEHLMR